ncbi:hypothetical protein XA68_16849 [Ophiocordyceps unilateralis]|uniref:Large ribosomal subunit protein mL46 n=1 Tax=Ophiocordyceps unilateralis TaxID=268505 RepID=A0A2A9P5K7_OPHUN|nr:hypothetical protein XA68_16849 [Ophiocordyceps unilateralis]
MSASSRGGRVLRGALTATPKQLCSRCAATNHTTAGRLYSSAAVETTTTTYPPLPLQTEADVTTQVGEGPPPLPYDLYSGVILTRAPLLTRRLEPFENAFFFYQKRLEERVNSKFIPSIYFKPDTVRLLDWQVKIKDRQGVVAKELGLYRGQKAMSWNDELRVGDELSSQDNITESLLKDAEARVSEDAEVLAPENIVPVPRPMPRETEADRVGDVTRLDRKLDRTLYLVMKGDEGWAFPAAVMVGEENLHESAQRVLDQAAGVNMNTWIVGRVPVAHLVSPPLLHADGTVQQKGRKTFFLKGRIMAGQANLTGNPFGFTQFKWLTRDELAEAFTPEYFHGVRNMMADR